MDKHIIAYIHEGICLVNHSASAKPKHMYVSIFNDLIHRYFSRGYIWLFFAIILRQIIDRTDFIQTMRVVEITCFFALTLGNWFICLTDVILNKERFLLSAKLMYLLVKLSF